MGYKLKEQSIGGRVEYEDAVAVRDGWLETDFVLDCVRHHLGSSAPEMVGNAPAADPDWNHVLSIADYHEVIPLVRASLPGAVTEDCPQDARSRIELNFQCWVANSLLYAHELVRIQDHLYSKGVRAIAFKGPTLAMRAYGNLWQRQLRDLDLLIAKADVQKAIGVLCASGYRIDAAYSGRRSEAFREDKHLSLRGEQSGTRIELHWAVSLPGLHFDLPFDRVWGRREYVSILGSPAATPCLDDLLLILSVHGASHYWMSLKWFCDIAALIRFYGEAEWAGLREEAARVGCLRLVLLALALTRDVTGAVLPPPAAREVEADATANILASEARVRLHSMAYPGFFERLFTSIRSRERFIHRARIAGSYVWSVLVRDNSQQLRPSPVLRSSPRPAARLFGVRVSAWDKLVPLVAAVLGRMPKHPVQGL